MMFDGKNALNSYWFSNLEEAFETVLDYMYTQGGDIEQYPFIDFLEFILKLAQKDRFHFLFWETRPELLKARNNYYKRYEKEIKKWKSNG